MTTNRNKAEAHAAFAMQLLFAHFYENRHAAKDKQKKPDEENGVASAFEDLFSFVPKARLSENEGHGSTAKKRPRMAERADNVITRQSRSARGSKDEMQGFIDDFLNT